MRKCKIIKEYPIIVGLIGIFMIAIFLLITQKQYINRQIENIAVNEDYERERNVTIRTPAEAMLYFEKAVQNDDIDQVMRIFPISYLAQKTNVTYCIEKKGAFYSNLTYAPTLNYRKYFPIASAEISGEYAEKYLEIKENFGIGFKQAELLDMKYIEVAESDELLKLIGASEICYYDAYYELSDELYKVRFTIVKYANEWLIYDVGKSIRTNKTALDEEYDYDSNIEKKINEYSKIRKKYKKILEEGDALWNTNYIWSNASYQATPELLMAEFMRCLQRENIDGLLTFGNHSLVMRNLDEIDANQLINRGVYAEQLKNFLYAFLLEKDTSMVTTLEKLELSASEIVSCLKPQYFFYTELVKMVPKDENVYSIVFKYEGMYFEFPFEFAKYEQGWQIYNIGNVSIYTPEEYNQMYNF